MEYLGAKISFTGIWHLAPQHFFQIENSLFMTQNLYSATVFSYDILSEKYVLERKLAERALYDNIRLTNRKNRHAYFDVFQEKVTPRNIKATR